MAASGQNKDKLHWKERWELEAGLEYERLSLLPEHRLLDRIKQNRTDHYYQIWRAIGNKGTIKDAPMILWEYLQQHPGELDMLHRYHCAAALFKILGMPDPNCKNELRQKVQWDHEGENARQNALLELKGIINHTQKSETNE
ncbi:MAG: hypothetical protein JXA42_03450 [Anaerolineales bacterium]|nr:hypothetical protein [Anaerolineales bacterium]